MSNLITPEVLVKKFHLIFGLKPSPSENVFLVPTEQIKEKRDALIDLYREARDAFQKMPLSEIGKFYQAVEDYLIVDLSKTTFHVQRQKESAYGTYSMHPILKMLQRASTVRRSMQLDSALLPDNESYYSIGNELGDGKGVSIGDFFGNSYCERQHIHERTPTAPAFQTCIDNAIEFEDVVKNNALIKQDFIEDPALIFGVFNHFIEQAGQLMPNRVRAVMMAEQICDTPLLQLSLEELNDVYDRYLKHHPKADILIAADGTYHDATLCADWDDPFSIGLRKLQSVIAARPEVKPHLKRSAIMVDGFMIDSDPRIQHLVGTTHGGYFTNYGGALKAALSGASPNPSSKQTAP